jgi:hypothetical protein
MCSTMPRTPSSTCRRRDFASGSRRGAMSRAESPTRYWPRPWAPIPTPRAIGHRTIIPFTDRKTGVPVIGAVRTRARSLAGGPQSDTIRSSMLSSPRHRACACIGEHRTQYDVREVSFETAQRLAPRLSFALGSVRDCVRAMVWRARFSWRLPPRFNRCRLVWPDDAGIGAVPLMAANAGAERKRRGSPVSPMIFAAVMAATRGPRRDRASVPGPGAVHATLRGR